jgi:hypothetical protein
MVACVILGGIVSLSLFCNVKKETFMNRANSRQLIGSDLGYSMGDGVGGSYDTSIVKSNTKSTCQNWFAPLAANTAGRQVPLGEHELALFSNNTQSPLCCPSTYSGSMGCVCETEAQMKYLNQRGGNRTSCSIY